MSTPEKLREAAEFFDREVAIGEQFIRAPIFIPEEDDRTHIRTATEHKRLAAEALREKAVLLERTGPRGIAPIEAVRRLEDRAAEVERAMASGAERLMFFIAGTAGEVLVRDLLAGEVALRRVAGIDAELAAAVDQERARIAAKVGALDTFRVTPTQQVVLRADVIAAIGAPATPTPTPGPGLVFGEPDELNVRSATATDGFEYQIVDGEYWSACDSNDDGFTRDPIAAANAHNDKRLAAIGGDR